MKRISLHTTFRPLLRCLLALPIPFALACEPEIAIGQASAPQTSRLAISKDGSTLYVALADHDLVRAIDARTGEVRGEVSVDGHPHRLTVLSDGRVAVSARYAGTVTVANIEGQRVDVVVDVGSDPFGLIEVDGGILVAVAGESDLARIDLADPTRVSSRIVLAHDDPRGLAKTEDGKVLVSHFTGGVLSVVRGDAAQSEIDMRLPSKPFFFPNQMDTVTIGTDGTQIAVPHVECNNDPAQFGAAGTDFTGASAAEYYVEGPTGYPAVVPAVSNVDIIGDTLLSDEDRSLPEAMGELPESEGAVAPVVNPRDRNLLLDEKMNAPIAVAYVDGGALQLIVSRGSGNVLVRRTIVERGQSSIIGVVDVGVGAEAIQVSPDGATAYVYNAFDDAVTSFAIPKARQQKSKFEGSRGSAAAFVTRAEPLTRIEPTAQFIVAAPALPENVRTGRVLFHSVSDELTRFGAISCASCHPGGADDGTTWSFAEGPRQSPALWGGILGTEPFHWDEAVTDMADISRVTIQGRMGGTGLGEDDMNKIGAFIDTLPVPAPPRAADLGSVERGEQIFFGEETQCASCHAGGSFTDNRTHDVGTGYSFTERETLTYFATPVLNGLAHSGPYLHDGSAKTLRDVIDRLVATNRMGHGSQLTEQDKIDLVAFLRTL